MIYTFYMIFLVLSLFQHKNACLTSPIRLANTQNNGYRKGNYRFPFHKFDCRFQDNLFKQLHVSTMYSDVSTLCWSLEDCHHHMRGNWLGFSGTAQEPPRLKAAINRCRPRKKPLLHSWQLPTQISQMPSGERFYRQMRPRLSYSTVKKYLLPSWFVTFTCFRS